MTVRIALLITAISITISQSCQPAAEKQVPQEKKAALYSLKGKFKYHDLQEFKIDSFSFDTRPGHYQKVDSNAFKLIFQEGDRQFTEPGYDGDYYYSWQNRDTNFIEFTILTRDESGYCDILCYYIFDGKGKFISKFDLAKKCSDVEWAFSGMSRQVDERHFIFETVATNIQDGTIPEDKKQEGDSINYSISIQANGTVIKKETFKKHFVDK